jgi:predicted ATPase with chaperone activity
VTSVEGLVESGVTGAEQAAPPIPESIQETGLTEDQIANLLLKALYQRGALSGHGLADVVALPYPLIDDLLLTAQQRHFVEVPQAVGHGREGYTYALTDEGRDRARAALESSRYVGAAPVPLGQFREWVERQSVKDSYVRREELEGVFSDLVLPPDVMDALGPAVNSGGSIFLHGAPGNGKTAIAERLGSLASSTIYMPRALIVHGHVMVLFDPVHHEPVQDGLATDPGSPLFRGGPPWDARFIKVRRPTVFVGGELTMDQLDLQFDPYSKVYQAPFQLKAACGVLIVDDFGRQRMRPEELLNRWIVPLEKGFDNLTLHSGIKFPVPFDCLLLFATNLNPRDLVDEAFLRRIQFKVEVRSPDRGAFEEIFRMNCDETGIDYDRRAVDLLYSEYYDAHGFPPRGCHPRDILHHVRSLATFEEREPTLEPSLLHRAARSYFLVMEEDYQVGIPSATLTHGD